MCPQTIFIWLFIIPIVVVFFYFDQKEAKRALANFETMSQVISSPKMNRWFLNFYMSIEGFYQGRKVRWIFSGGEDGPGVGFSMEPNCQLKVRFTLVHPKPTSQTFLMGSKIFVQRGLFRDNGKFLMPLLTKEEIIQKLNELVAAAKIVETDPSYPKK